MSSSLHRFVDQYYENSNKYSHTPVPTMPHQVNQNTKMKASSPSSYTPPAMTISEARYRPHTNAVIKAGKLRALDEQDMQIRLQNLQLHYNIYNSDIEPEHETDHACSCKICSYRRKKTSRLYVQHRWSTAVKYPGEKFYHDCYRSISNYNPYQFYVVSPFGPNFFRARKLTVPDPWYHAQSIHQTIQMNAKLNAEAQAAIDAKEPAFNIWEAEERQRIAGPSTNGGANPAKLSKLAAFKKAFSIKSPEEKAAIKIEKTYAHARELRNSILKEENGRWPDQEWRQIVATYQEKVGMAGKIADLRDSRPIQYLHLLRAGYFEPIPVAWANQNSNPLKFTVEAAAGWRGITPTWRGYEDTAEERLYWVLNHREGSVGARMKPDMISELDMARARMASAVEPPPAYYSADDTCHLQHTSEGYSRQVMPAPFRAFDAAELPTDDTMILLDVSGSMDFDPVRPIYNQYLITGYSKSTQPKNKDVAKAIIRRFADAMANHDHNGQGYQLTTFSSYADHIGVINHWNFDAMWSKVQFGRGTRVMTGWQKVKELHFQKHSESATYHPTYGWQPGPQTPILRLLLLLDGEAIDMDEFELDLLSLSWVHVTIFLIGVDGCPHHHRHANELQRISDTNHHVSFVDAQGNTPERFVTHELLKRHLGYELSMTEFEQLEQLPPYSA